MRWRVCCWLSSPNRKRTNPTVGRAAPAAEIDGNHPFTGKDVVFKITVANVENATAEELAHNTPTEEERGGATMRIHEIGRDVVAFPGAELASLLEQTETLREIDTGIAGRIRILRADDRILIQERTPGWRSPGSRVAVGKGRETLCRSASRRL